MCSSNNHINLFVCVVDGCTNGSIRTPLLNGAVSNEGFVQVCVNGTYYPVSLDNGRFSVREATVICTELGLGNGEVTCILKPNLNIHN